MESESLHLQLNNQNNRNADLLRTLLDRLDSAGVQIETEDLRSSLKSTPATVRSQIISKLKKKYLLYCPPSLTLEGLSYIQEKQRKIIIERAELKNRYREIAYYEHNVNQEPVILEVGAGAGAGAGVGAGLQRDHILFDRALPENLGGTPALNSQTIIQDYSKPLIYQSKITKGVCPISGKIFKRPLQYIYEIKDDIFTDSCIVKYPIINSINIQETLDKMLDHCILLGLSRKQFSELLVKFVHRFFSEYIFTLQQFTKPVKIFEATLNLINTQDISSLCNNQMNALVRAPTENIFTFFLKYSSLLKLKTQYLEPGLNQDQLDKKAERNSLNAIIKYINEKTKKQYQLWIQNQKQIGNKPTREECLNYISALENSDQSYCLSEPKQATVSAELFKNSATNVNQVKPRAESYNFRQRSDSYGKYRDDRRRHKGNNFNKKYSDSRYRPYSRSRSTSYSRDRNRSRRDFSRSTSRDGRQQNYNRQRSSSGDRSSNRQRSQSPAFHGFRTPSKSPHRGPIPHDRNRDRSQENSAHKIRSRTPSQERIYNREERWRDNRDGNWRKGHQNRYDKNKPKIQDLHRQMNYLSRKLEELKAENKNDTKNNDSFLV